MRTVSIALTICACLIVAHASSPLHIWSNIKYFNGKNIKAEELVSNSDVKSLFKGQGPLGKYLEAERPQPEAIVIFLEPEGAKTASLGVAEAAVGSNLQGVIGKGTSSISVQAASPAGTTATLELIQNLQPQATVTLAQSQNCPLLSALVSRTVNTKYVSLEELKNMATTKWDVLSNGVSDVVIACLNSQSGADTQNSNAAYIDTLLTSMGSSYLAIFSSAQPVLTDIGAQDKQLGKVPKMVSEVQDDVSEDGSVGSELIQAVIVMAPFLGILILGIWCTFGIQSELKFDLEKKKK